MDPLTLIFLLLAAGVVLLIGELLLPTHGILGLAGLFALGAAVVVVFTVNKWAGLVIFVAAVIASPFILSLGMKMWSKSPVGKGIILEPAPIAAARPNVSLGQVGVVVSQLRPMGECEFGDIRVEAVSDMGIIDAGTKIRIVTLDGGRPTVRVATETNNKSNA